MALWQMSWCPFFWLILVIYDYNMYEKCGKKIHKIFLKKKEEEKKRKSKERRKIAASTDDRIRASWIQIVT